MTELESSTGALELPLRLHHFTTHSRIKIRCTASIYGIYWQTTEKSAELERHRNGLMHNDVTEHDVINQNLLHLEPPAKEEEEEEITVVHGKFCVITAFYIIQSRKEYYHQFWYLFLFKKKTLFL